MNIPAESDVFADAKVKFCTSCKVKFCAVRKIDTISGEDEIKKK